MGRETRNFRQTARSNSANSNNKSYAKINRGGVWSKIFSPFKLKKGEIK